MKESREWQLLISMRKMVRLQIPYWCRATPCVPSTSPRLSWRTSSRSATCATCSGSPVPTRAVVSPSWVTAWVSRPAPSMQKSWSPTTVWKPWSAWAPAAPYVKMWNCVTWWSVWVPAPIPRWTVCASRITTSPPSPTSIWLPMPYRPPRTRAWPCA